MHVCKCRVPDRKDVDIADLRSCMQNPILMCCDRFRRPRCETKKFHLLMCVCVYRCEGLTTARRQPCLLCAVVILFAPGLCHA